MDGKSVSVCCQQLNILASFMLPHNIFNNNGLIEDIPLCLRNIPNANQFLQFCIVTINIKVWDTTE